MDTIPEDLLQQAESGPSMGPEGINRVWVSLNNPNPAVVENLQGLAKVVANRHLPRVQGWLKALVKVSIHPDCRTHPKHYTDMHYLSWPASCIECV